MPRTPNPSDNEDGTSGTSATRGAEYAIVCLRCSALSPEFLSTGWALTSAPLIESPTSPDAGPPRVGGQGPWTNDAGGLDVTPQNGWLYIEAQGLCFSVAVPLQFGTFPLGSVPVP